MATTITTAELHERFVTCTGTSTDTRTISKDCMFFALKGPNFNANAFAAEALEKGAKYAVVDEAPEVMDARYLLVPDVLQALQQLATHHRRKFDIPVIGITGSNGKTTTKELVHAVLSADRATLATSGNLNNHIGVPLTLLRLTAEHRIAIIEMGANKVGDIAELTAIAEPTHGLITNIGKAHLEGFGSYEGVIIAKTEMYDFLDRHKGSVFVNADDPLLMEKSAGVRRVTYGSTGDPDLLGCVQPSNDAFLRCSFDHRDDTWCMDTRLIGAYNLPNVLAAACIGLHFKVDPERIVDAIDGYEPSNNRSQFSDTGRNHLVLDAYNANPSSMQVALENFAAMPTNRPKLAVLGGMKELGADSRAEHTAVVDTVQRLGVDAMFVGPEFMELESMGITTYPDAKAALEGLKQKPLTGYLILVKGSRGTKLETLVEGL